MEFLEKRKKCTRNVLTMKRILILSAILLFLIFIALETRAQDRTPTAYGYTLDFAHVYVEVDTIHHTSQVFNYYHCKMFYSVNGGKATELKRAQAVSYTHLTLPTIHVECRSRWSPYH